MKTVTVTIPTSPDELAEQRRLAAEAEAKRQRENLARSNRSRLENVPEPKPGSTYYVATARGLKVRGRAGLVFSPTPAEVKVVDKNDEEVEALQRQGTYVVNPWGAEQIIGDSNGEQLGLIVFSSKAEGDAASVADASTEALEAELARRKSGATRDGAGERLSHSSRKADTGKTSKTEG